MDKTSELLSWWVGATEDDRKRLVSADGMLSGVYQETIRRLLGVSPVGLSIALEPAIREREHLDYLDAALVQATKWVEGGESRFLVVSMPPRMGKSHLTSIFTPVWLLHSHPDWKIGLISHSPTLASSWGRQVRRVIEEHGAELGLSLAKDAGAVSDWQTTQGGGVVSRSAPGQSIIGLGFKVLLIDDIVKDFKSAHSEKARDEIWDWWLTNAQSRLEPPSLVVVVGTRWHEDDFIGRLLTRQPDKWEVIHLPAIAEENDQLGRAPGEPLISPLLDETPEEAIERWAQVERDTGPYGWAGMYQQRPAPAKGAIFLAEWFRFWTSDPDLAELYGAELFDPAVDGAHGDWVDSWDLTYGTSGDKGGDYVVGQRWCRVLGNRYLVAQQRGRWSFTEQIAALKRWAVPGPGEDRPGYDPRLNPFGRFVHRRLVENAANGAAAIDTLRKAVSGIKPVNPRDSKVIRAHAITSELASGNVFFPLPQAPGNEWVNGLISELVGFPNAAHDDQVDTLTQALADLRSFDAVSTATVPGRARVSRSDYSALARTARRISR